MHAVNETHDPTLTSWVESANRAGTDFPVQNLPFGVFRRQGADEAFRGGVAIGEAILDLAAAQRAGVFSGQAAGAAAACAGATLNAFMALGPEAWSARDIQAWEYQPLGPFLSKNFASTLSPWIVTLEALAPYRLEWTRPQEDPQPLAYLDSPDNRTRGAIDIQLEVWLETDKMRQDGQPPARLSRTSFKHAYWTLFQMIAHHTVNGCALAPGDLLGSGTMSGPTPEEAGSLLELSRGGKQPVRLPNGETRTFLEDGDAVILQGFCERPGAARIGFGECRSTVLPAIPL